MSRVQSTHACCTASAASRDVGSGQLPRIHRAPTRCLVYLQDAVKQMALTATVLSLTVVASPALAALASSDYISVQERSRQRAPLQQTNSERNALPEAPSTSSPATRLSVSQQARYEGTLNLDCSIS